MEINVNLKISTTSELTGLLQQFLNGPAGAAAKPAVSSDNKLKKVTESTPASTTSTTEDNKSETKVTVEQIKNLVVELARGGKKAAVEALLKEFGASGVKELKGEQYSDFFTKLSAIKTAA